MVKPSKKSSQPNNREYFDVKEAEKQLKKRASDYHRYAKNIIDLVPLSSGRLLDVGCGLGWLVKEAQNRGFDACGIDPAIPYVRLGRKYLKVDLQVASLESFKTKEKFDIVTLNHVLEHIKDLKTFLAKINRLLVPNGFLLVACPNISSLMHFIFRRRWYGLVPSQHHWQFTPLSLSKIINQNGFKIIRVIVNSLDYQTPGWKGLIFAVLVNFANLIGRGDQVIIIGQKR